MRKNKLIQKTFKLQVYVEDEMVKSIDKICTKQQIHRSYLVNEAIARFLKLNKYKKILEAQ